MTTARRVLAHPSFVYIAFGIMTVALAVLLFVMPARAASILFILLLAAPLAAAVIVRREAILIALIDSRSLIAAALAIGAIICMAYSAYHFRPKPESLIHYRPTDEPESYYDAIAVNYLIAGAGLLIGALVLSRHARPFRKPLAARLTPAFRRWTLFPEAILFGAGTAALLALAEINGGLLKIESLRGVSPARQFALLVAGIILIALSLGGLSFSLKPPFNRRRGKIIEDRTFLPAVISVLSAVKGFLGREIVIVGIITLVGLAARFWQLGESVRMMVDEGHFALGINYFWHYPDVRLLEPMPTAASFPYIFSYLQTQAVELFGRNFTGLRAVSAALGTLTIPALYLLARHLYDRLTAVMAALLLAAFPPHIHFSRLGLNNIADPLFGVLALGFAARALHTGRRLDYALAGVSLGLTQYFYEGGRLLYPALIIGWLGMGFVLWRPRPSLHGVIILVLAFVLVAMPVYYTLQGRDFPLMDRMDKTELNEDYWARNREPDTLETRITHFKHSLMMYVNSPENTFVYYYLYYGGDQPLILVYIVPAFLLGVVIAAWRWYRPGFLPVPWLIGTSLGNAMLVESAVTPRYVVVFPALALLIAVGIRYTIPLIWPQLRPFRRLLANAHTLLIVGLTVGLAADQLAYYYGPFLDTFNEEARAHVAYDVDDALLRSADFPPGTEVHIIAYDTLPPLDAQRLMNFLADGISVSIMHPADFQTFDLALLPRHVPHAFFLIPGDEATLQKLRTAFVLDGPHTTPYDVPTGKALVLYYIPAQPVQAVGMR